VSTLLTLTDNAMQAVRDILASSSELPESGGLRVARRGHGNADEPRAQHRSARVFLEPQAASLLDDKVLDVTVEENQVAFTIADQSEAS
jgi:iron-sulfur cluster assembly protein